jgi:hypothetical protein
LKLSISPEGVQTMVFRTEKDDEFMEPYSKDHGVYSVYRSHRDKGKLPWTCTTVEKNMAEDISSRVESANLTGSSTGQLKTMRLVQSCNGEYANYFGATNSSQVAIVLAAFNATLTRCNGVYEKDLALHLNLIANTTLVIYYNPSTDPYTNLSSWNLQLQKTLTSVIGNANYDIGHMFGASGGGGNAGCIGCVCVNPPSSNSLGKGSGITSPADGIPMGDNFDIDYVVHEVGHQLGANHTFSMSLEGTGVNKEVGSGITIMGYAGITSQDVAPHSIDIFHEASIAQIQANLANKTCPITTNITANNTAPVIAAVNNYTIPISTPFALTGSATDGNGDALTYCWEQNDNSTTSGSGSVASPTKATGPNWLSFSPTTSGTRTFPKLSTILSGLNVTPPLPGGDAGANIEALSSVSRNLNFRLTVRDNHAYSSTAPVAVGQTAFTDVIVTVTNTSGPFQVTAPNTNVTWNGGSAATVTWNVNGTNGGSVNCAAVNILLSTDGGNNFTTVLASSTANDGSEVITVPSTPGTTNRIKVEAAGNIFFDISNTNFTIAAGPACGNPADLAASLITQTTATVSWNTVSGATSYDVDYKEASSLTWINAATATASTSVNLSGLTASTLYDWRVRATCPSGTGSYTSSQFTTAAVVTCNAATGLAASAITETSATVSWTADGSATSYDVDYKDASSGTWINAATATTNTFVDLAGLIANTVYDWRIRVNCAAGTGSYVSAQFTTLAPCNAPAGLSASGITSSSATVSWSAASGAANYDVDYKEALSPTWINAVTATTLTSRNITGLAASTLYDWRVRTNCTSGLTSNYSQAQFTTTAVSTCPGSYDAGTNGTIAGAAGIPLNIDINGLIDVRGDNDYYQFIITTGGTITISLTTLPADYQLDLLNSGGTVLQSSTNNGTANETINRTVTAGTYYARVYPKSNGAFNAGSCYTLRVQTGTASKNGGSADMLYLTTKLSVFPNPARNTVNLVFNTEEGGSATISVINQTGSVVLNKIIGVNTGDNTRKLDVGNLANGMYFIKIQKGSAIQMAKLVVAK